MKIYVLRHGETIGNVARIMDGSKDVPLTEKGKEQARLAGESLRDIPFTHIYCSPLSRAIRTMELALARPVSYEVDDRLIERSCQSVLGKTFDEVDRYAYWHVTRNEELYPGCESIASLFARVHSFLDDLKATLPEDAVVLIACHAGISRAVRGYYEDFPEDGCILDWGLGNAEFKEYEL